GGSAGGAAPAGLSELAAVHRAMSEAIRRKLILSCHDVSDGGWLVAVAEMAIAGNLGAKLDAAKGAAPGYFDEFAGRYIVEAHGQAMNDLRDLAQRHGVELTPIGRTSAGGAMAALEVSQVEEGNPSERVDCHVPVADLLTAWRGTLDWA